MQLQRGIVLIRGQEALQDGWRRRSFAPAGASLEEAVHVAGVSFDEAYHPVWVSRIPPGTAANRFTYGAVRADHAYVLRVAFDDQDAVERLRRDRPARVIGVFADPVVSPFPLPPPAPTAPARSRPPYCGDEGFGDTEDVARRLGVPALRRAGLTGRNVHIAVVDTGIDGRRIPVSGGWAPAPDYVPGSSPPDHGTMVAYDARIAAPDAEILDYALLRSDAGSWAAFLSDAIAAFADLVDRVRAAPGRWVVNNSWGLFSRASDAPIGSPENYSANPEHPFNQITAALVTAGADVFFAAGNCGADCADPRCGAGDTGPGASIHGANSHPDVVTVAAVTVTDRRLGYSSQGPGALYSRKPDLAGFSHFVGSGIYPIDGGTSAASPVAAGVAAALRERFATDRLSPAQLKGLLQRTARDLEHVGWDYELGYGVIDAAAALKGLGVRPPVKKRVRAKRVPTRV